MMIDDRIATPLMIFLFSIGAFLGISIYHILLNFKSKKSLKDKWRERDKDNFGI